MPGGEIARFRARLRPLRDLLYRSMARLLSSLNGPLAVLLRRRVFPNSVLHISYMVHIPFHTTRHLRKQGVKADYLAIGASPFWDQCDYCKIDSPHPLLQAWQEIMLFWTVVARYEIVHMHFMIGLSTDGWELPLLKKMGRRIVIHYRGCEIRDREKNMALHPRMNICQKCDYNATICTSPLNHRRRALATRYGDAFLVTTPDMLDFVPDAQHLAFFAQEVDPAPAGERLPPAGQPFRIVHVTGHPGIEGTGEIQAAIDRLRAQGRRIDFVVLQNVPHHEALAAFRGADLAIGKMKMGYYANAQIESMALGVPTITYVREEFLTDELRKSGFIFCDPDTLEATLTHYLDHPEELEKKRAVARSSILRLHDAKSPCRDSYY